MLLSFVTRLKDNTNGESCKKRLRVPESSNQPADLSGPATATYRNDAVAGHASLCGHWDSFVITWLSSRTGTPVNNFRTWLRVLIEQTPFDCIVIAFRDWSSFMAAVAITGRSVAWQAFAEGVALFEAGSLTWSNIPVLRPRELRTAPPVFVLEWCSAFNGAVLRFGLPVDRNRTAWPSPERDRVRSLAFDLSFQRFRCRT